MFEGICCFDIVRKLSFNYLLYKLGLYIITYFGHGQCFISEFLVLAFIKTELKTGRLNTKD